MKTLRSLEMKKLKKGFHPSIGPNRRKMRQKTEQDKPGKLYVVGKNKYRTMLQIIREPGKRLKRIIHYV